MAVGGSPDVHVHSAALCESDDIGAGTRIWAFAHVMRGARIGRDCNICDHAFVESGAVIGNGVVIKNRVMVWNGVTIEDFAFIGPGVAFTNDKFPRSRHLAVAAARYDDEANWLERTVVHTGAALGAGAVLAPGIEIGAYAMVAAGAVVTRSVEPYALVAGNPARLVGRVDESGRRVDGAGPGA